MGWLFTQILLWCLLAFLLGLFCGRLLWGRPRPVPADGPAVDLPRPGNPAVSTAPRPVGATPDTTHPGPAPGGPADVGPRETPPPAAPATDVDNPWSRRPPTAVCAGTDHTGVPGTDPADAGPAVPRPGGIGTPALAHTDPAVAPTGPASGVAGPENPAPAVGVDTRPAGGGRVSADPGTGVVRPVDAGGAPDAVLADTGVDTRRDAADPADPGHVNLGHADAGTADTDVVSPGDPRVGPGAPGVNGVNGVAVPSSPAAADRAPAAGRITDAGPAGSRITDATDTGRAACSVPVSTGGDTGGGDPGGADADHGVDRAVGTDRRTVGGDNGAPRRGDGDGLDHPGDVGHQTNHRPITGHRGTGGDGPATGRPGAGTDLPGDAAAVDDPDPSGGRTTTTVGPGPRAVPPAGGSGTWTTPRPADTDVDPTVPPVTVIDPAVRPVRNGATVWRAPDIDDVDPDAPTGIISSGVVESVVAEVDAPSAGNTPVTRATGSPPEPVDTPTVPGTKRLPEPPAVGHPDGARAVGGSPDAAVGRPRDTPAVGDHDDPRVTVGAADSRAPGERIPDTRVTGGVSTTPVVRGVPDVRPPSDPEPTNAGVTPPTTPESPGRWNLAPTNPAPTNPAPAEPAPAEPAPPDRASTGSTAARPVVSDPAPAPPVAVVGVSTGGDAGAVLTDRPGPGATVFTAAVDVPPDRDRPPVDVPPPVEVDRPYGPGSARALADGSAPSGEYQVKGNAQSMLYHTVDSPYFSRTRAEAWFMTAADAEQAGFQPWNRGRPGVGTRVRRVTPAPQPGPYPGSAMPVEDGSSPTGDFTVKGNTDSMLFHTIDSPYFTRTRAEIWFRDAEAAEEAGFTAWNKRRAHPVRLTAAVEAGPYPGSAMPTGDGTAPAPEYTIKGNMDSMLYHTRRSPFYTVTRAEVWFAAERDAEDAGFRPWTR